MSTAVHITWHGAQKNFGDLPPYLTYDLRFQSCHISRDDLTPLLTWFNFLTLHDSPSPEPHQQFDKWHLTSDTMLARDCSELTRCIVHCVVRLSLSLSYTASEIWQWTMLPHGFLSSQGVRYWTFCPLLPPPPHPPSPPPHFSPENELQC